MYVLRIPSNYIILITYIIFYGWVLIIIISEVGNIFYIVWKREST